MEYLGEFEQLVLLAILRLGAKAYGMTIRQVIHEVAGRPASLGAVYTTLERLQDKGLVSSWAGESTEQRGGRAKKYFAVTMPGEAALRQALRSTEAMKAGLKPILGGL